MCPVNFTIIRHIPPASQQLERFISFDNKGKTSLCCRREALGFN